MKFRTALLLQVFFMSFIFSGSIAQAKKNFPFRKIEGYRPRPNAWNGSGFKMELFFSKDGFLNIFEKNPAQPKKDELNFSRYTLVACYGNQTATETSLSLDKITASDGILKVYYKVFYGKKSNKPSVPFSVYSFMHDPALSGVDYYLNNKLVQELRN